MLSGTDMTDPAFRRHLSSRDGTWHMPRGGLLFTVNRLSTISRGS
jgi:hypothetical protein